MRLLVDGRNAVWRYCGSKVRAMKFCFEAIRNDMLANTILSNAADTDSIRTGECAIAPRRAGLKVPVTKP